MSEFEVRRQQALLAAMAAPTRHAADAVWRETGARAERGLAAYRANGAASAERALAALFATVQTMIGADDFGHLARAFWHAHPPLRGDLAEWGTLLPAWIEAHADLAAWPYLGDCARLDLARHDCERAADAALDVASLALLESTDPAALRLLPMPGMALLRSPWPIAMIHAAHHADADADADGDNPAHAEAAFAAVRVALAAQCGETVLVARRGWRAEVHPIGETEACWMTDLLAGRSLADALDHAGAEFDFGAWLATALREPWLKGVAVSRD